MGSVMRYIRFVRSFGFIHLYRNCISRYQLNADQLSIPARAFDSSMSLIPLCELIKLYEEINNLCGDPDFVLNTMKNSQLDKRKMIGRWILSSKDVATCVRRFNGGMSCIHSGALMQFSQVGNLIKWSYDIEGVPRHIRVHDSVRFAIFMIKVLREYLGQHYAPLRVMLSGQRADTGSYRAFFGCEVVWGHKRTEIWIQKDDINVTHPRINNGTEALAMTYDDLDSLLNMPNPEEESKTISELIKYARYYGFPTVDKVAELMEVSPQQLQRKLNSLGVNFTILSAHVFSVYAVSQLSKGMSSEDIAYSLGCLYTHLTLPTILRV
ncbi:AraC family transcriptional regulator ligand-binding domain-containing protein [Vibrio sp. FNV 38]|nr:AraC family transcriptional regulator ligand-binding domain-containing protein [Vibrio sp. FNV 38]